MRLRTALFSVLVVVAIVLAGTVYAGFALHQESLTTQEQNSLDIAAEGIAGNIDARLAERKLTVGLLSADPVAAEHGTQSQQALVERALAHGELNGASIVDTDGQVRAIAAHNLDDPNAVIGNDLSGRTYVQRALEGETSVSDPFTAETGNDLVAISTPVLADGEIVGVFTGTIHVDAAGFFGPTYEDRPDRAVTVSVDDQPLYESRHPPEDALTAQATVRETGWEVRMTQDRAALDDRLWQTTIAQTGAVLLALVLIAMIGVWISRTTLQSLDELIGGMSQLQEGTYDAEIDLGSTDEWVRLSAQFNNLSAALAQRDSQLRVLNRVLRHNLRNDMSVVIAHTDTLLHSDIDETHKGQVRKIQQTAHSLIGTSDHARAIYEEVLDGDSGEATPVDLARVVERTTDALRSEFPSSNIETDIPATAWTLGGKTVPLIVDELCRNALEHNDQPPAERTVTLRAEGGIEEGEVRLFVSDNGPGLPTLERDLLSGDREQTSIEHGSGLGLWVVAWLVDQLGGSITADDRAGRGTTVTVTLPAPEEPPKTLRSKSRTTGNGTDASLEDDAGKNGD